MTRPTDPDAILARLGEIGAAIHSHTAARDAMAEERRALYEAGEAAGLTHKRMADVQGVSEGAVTLALRKLPGRVAARAAKAAAKAAEG